MLSKILSGLVVVLVLLSALVLFTSVEPHNQKSEPLQKHIVSFPSRILSRLTLFPSSRSSSIPIAVMIENHQQARPYHEGLADALLIQEFLVEGFISRFVALFDAAHLPKEIGPVRSLRPYFLDAIKPWTTTIFHAGGSPEALARTQEGTEFFARNLLYFDDAKSEYGSLRHTEVPAPHNLFLNRDTLNDLLSNVPAHRLEPLSLPLYPVGTSAGGEEATHIRLNFFSTDHNVQFDYLPLAQKYQRTNGEEISKARPSTVVILEIPIDSIGEYGRLFMTLVGSGRARVFHSGNVWNGHWTRNTDTEKFRIFDEDGEDILFKSGQIWITVLPTFERLSWE